MARNVQFSFDLYTIFILCKRDFRFLLFPFLFFPSARKHTHTPKKNHNRHVVIKIPLRVVFYTRWMQRKIIMKICCINRLNVCGLCKLYAMREGKKICATWREEFSRHIRGSIVCRVYVELLLKIDFFFHPLWNVFHFTLAFRLAKILCICVYVTRRFPVPPPL